MNIERKLKQDTLDIYKALIDWMENCPYDIGEEISDERLMEIAGERAQSRLDDWADSRHEEMRRQDYDN